MPPWSGSPSPARPCSRPAARAATATPTSRSAARSSAPTARSTNCGDIQWEPQSVEGPKGFPAAGPADGTICAGGNSRFAQLDDPRGGTGWPTTKLTGGQTYTFRWQFTARHATTDFSYYLTKQGWDPTQPLTRAALDTQPFLTVPYGGKQPPATLSHQGTIPTGGPADT